MKRKAGVALIVLAYAVGVYFVIVPLVYGIILVTHEQSFWEAFNMLTVMGLVIFSVLIVIGNKLKGSTQENGLSSQESQEATGRAV
jgi:intracellular septation protein A